MPIWSFAISKSNPPIQFIFISILFLSGLVPFSTKKVAAEVVLSCDLAATSRGVINRAIADYVKLDDPNFKNTVVSNQIKASSTGNVGETIQITNLGIKDAAGNSVSYFYAIASSLITAYQQQGLSADEANIATLTTLSQWISLPDSSSTEVVNAIEQSVIAKLGEERTEIELPDAILTILAGLQPSSLANLGLTAAEIEAISAIAISPQAEGTLSDRIQAVFARAIDSLERPEAKAILTEAQAQIETEVNNIRQGRQTTFASGSNLSFAFRLNNPSETTAEFQLPTVQNITDGLVGKGRVTEVIYSLGGEQQSITDTDGSISLPAGQALDLIIRVEVGEIDPNRISSIGIDLKTTCGDGGTSQTFDILPAIALNEKTALIDPLGQISGCAGELLSDYLGFSVGLYDIDPGDPTASEPSGLTSLTATELPNDPDNEIPPGIEPNTQNSNPFFLTNNDEGKYSFLFDEDLGQLDKGRNYILVVDPGEDSTYSQRRVKLTIGDRQDRVVQYTATSLDGRPISAQSGDTTVTGEIVLVEDAERVGLNLAVLDLATNVCDAEEIAIVKTGDRATAEPGDIVLYRLAIRSLASVPLNNFQIVDTLPVGFSLMDDSIMAEANSVEVGIETVPSSPKGLASRHDRVVSFSANTTLEQGQTLNLVYAAQVTPDAVRGTAENSAIVNAQRTDNNLTVKDGPAIHNLRLEPGIMRDSGTLIGRVFVDKNFDGEQQKGEPGVPNAVVYLDNGNRIITDADGLFSVANVLPGYHTGILDLTTIPEYRLAPNLRFSESNSNSRLVNLEPGGMVRMNFAVTPTAEGKNADSQKSTAPPKSNESETPNSED